MGIAGVLRGGIQRKLILSYLALGIIPMVLMGFISYYNSSSILVEQTRGQMNGLARKAIEQVESQIAVHKDQMEYLFLPWTTILNFMEVGMEIDGGSREQALKEIQKIQKKSPAIRRVRLFDAKGAEKFSTHAAGAQASSQSWFQAALNGKETSVSDIFRSQETKEPVMLLAKSAATQDGKAYAVLAVDLASSQVLSALENTKMDLKGGYLYIVNKDGWVVSHPDKTKVLEVNVSRDAYGKEILQKKTGMVEYDSEGKSRLASFQEYPPMNWIIVSTVERGVLFHSVDKVKTLFLLLGVAFAGVSLFLAVVMSIQVARPVG
ncbi:MAG TPA: cache domain-containing protein, partial [Thermodesulfobacteriota bacterium]|nr:cache domain-containing protein [Thermodesulfobacteriota bacterium]